MSNLSVLSFRFFLLMYPETIAARTTAGLARGSRAGKRARPTPLSPTPNTQLLPDRRSRNGFRCRSRYTRTIQSVARSHHRLAPPTYLVIARDWHWARYIVSGGPTRGPLNPAHLTRAAPISTDAECSLKAAQNRWRTTGEDGGAG